MIQSDSTRIRVNLKLLTRFFSKIYIHPQVTFNGSPCWIWIAYRDKWGYGRFQFQNRSCRAHQVSFGMFDHIAPDGSHTDHLCRNPPCVNPAHMENVPPRINILRGEGKAARHARKTHCENGHEFTPENVYVNPKHPNWRGCRTCMKAVVKRANARLRAITAAKPKPTHCRNGHEYTRPSSKDYKHRCLVCMRENAARYRQEA